MAGVVFVHDRTPLELSTFQLLRDVGRESFGDCEKFRPRSGRTLRARIDFGLSDLVPAFSGVLRARVALVQGDTDRSSA